MDSKTQGTLGDIEPVKECSDFTSQDECEQEGCYWYMDSCHEEELPCPPFIEINNVILCELCSGFWWDSACHEEPKPLLTCEEIFDPDECLNAECFWYDNGCHTFPKEEPEPCPACPAIYTPGRCLECGCFWWDGACHGTPPPVIICEDIEDETACINQGCHWYDDSCHSESEEVMTIEEIDRELHDRLYSAQYITSTYLTEVVDHIFITYGGRITEVENTVIPISEFLTDEVKTSITAIVEAFGTPESLVSFLLNAPPGEEEAMLVLMQLLITNTLELGIELP